MMNSNPSSVDISPTNISERINSIDILRGCAILGILMINIEFFAQPLAKLLNPTISVNLCGLASESYVNNIACFDYMYGSSRILIGFICFIYLVNLKNDR